MRDEGGVLASSMLIGHPITYVITVEQTQLTQRNLSTDLRASPAYFHFPCWDCTSFQGTELLSSKTRALQNAVSQAHGVNDLQQLFQILLEFYTPSPFAESQNPVSAVSFSTPAHH